MLTWQEAQAWFIKQLSRNRNAIYVHGSCVHDESVSAHRVREGQETQKLREHMLTGGWEMYLWCDKLNVLHLHPDPVRVEP